MQMLPANTTDISHPELFQLFLKQLKKDFEYSNINIDFVEDLTADYDLILAALAKQMNILIKNTNFKLNELLYRIDISEQQIAKINKAKPNTEFVLLISELIIKRILQKVVIKEMHRKSN